MNVGTMSEEEGAGSVNRGAKQSSNISKKDRESRKYV